MGFRCAEVHTHDADRIDGIGAAARDCVGQPRLFLPCCSCFVACLPWDDVSALGKATSDRRGDRGARARAGLHTAQASGGRGGWAIERAGYRQRPVCRIERLPAVGTAHSLGPGRARDACGRDSGTARSAPRRGLVQRDAANVYVRARFLNRRRCPDRRPPVAARGHSGLPEA